MLIAWLCITMINNWITRCKKKKSKNRGVEKRFLNLKYFERIVSFRKKQSFQEISWMQLFMVELKYKIACKINKGDILLII